MYVSLSLFYNLAGAPWRIPWWKLVNDIGFCLEHRQAAMYGQLQEWVIVTHVSKNSAPQSYFEVPLAQTCKLAARSAIEISSLACQHGGGKVEWSGFALHMCMCFFFFNYVHYNITTSVSFVLWLFSIIAGLLLFIYTGSIGGTCHWWCN